MLETIGYVALASTAAAGGAAALLTACRRRRDSGSVRGAGAMHLASHVGEISDARFRLRLPDGTTPPRRRAITLLRPG